MSKKDEKKGKRLHRYVLGGVGKSTFRGVYENLHGYQGSSIVLKVRYYGVIVTYPTYLTYLTYPSYLFQLHIHTCIHICNTCLYTCLYVCRAERVARSLGAGRDTIGDG